MKIGRWFDKGRKWHLTAYVGFLICCVVLVIGSVNYLFALAGVRTSPVSLIQVKPLPPQAKGNAITAAVAFMGGALGLATFIINYYQKNTHFTKQHNQERAQAEYDSIAAEYDALSKDFTSGQILAQINAAVGLSSVALRADPRKTQNYDSPHEIDSALPRTKEYFPWFERIAMQFAAALVLYDEDSSRHYVKIAIYRMVDFCKDTSDNSQFLLGFLSGQLANANRQSFKEFTKAVAETSVYSSDDNKMLKQLSCILSESDDCKSLLEECRQSSTYHLVVDSLKCSVDKVTLRSTKIIGFQEEISLNSFVNSIGKLKDTRDSLAYCFASSTRKASSRISDSLMKLSRDESGIEALFLENFSQQATWSIDLSSCFFRGADLKGANLSCTKMDDAQFNGAYLEFAIFDCSVIKRANFSGAHLNETSFRLADLDAAVFNNALTKLDFSGANLRNCDFRQANVNSCKVINALAFGAQWPLIILSEKGKPTFQKSYRYFPWKDALWLDWEVDTNKSKMAFNKEDQTYDEFKKHMWYEYVPDDMLPRDHPPSI